MICGEVDVKYLKETKTKQNSRTQDIGLGLGLANLKINSKD